MSGLETAIRQALDRSDRSNAEIRARIYQSARNALETGLKKQDVHEATVIAQQRHRLEAIIHGIETEERAALKASAAVSAPPPLRLDEDVIDSGDPLARIDDGVTISARREPEDDQASPIDDHGLGGLRPERFEAGDTERLASTAAVSDVKPRDRRKDKISPVMPREKTRKRRRGRFLSLLMVAATLVAAFGTFAWWAQTSGLLKSAAERDTSVANPPAKIQSEDFEGDTGLKTLGNQSGFSGAWIDVFTGAETSSVAAGERATLEPMNDEAGQRVRLTSASADAPGNVTVEIPVSVLEQLSGKTSTVALSVRSGTDKPTQFSVECDFASLGDCGRHRFTVNDEKSDMLFKVTFDRSLAPSTPGHLVINSDVGGDGNSLNLFAIRILPGE